jgi:enoyl-[acyl-carrier protein] reductase/trans-2-enoyl-CoA reductase (NAD+)
VTEVTIEPASEQEVADTIAVMGGEDWKRWMEMLLEENLLASGARTLAYSYIGPEMTWPIYRDGTIGQAKKDLDRAAGELSATMSNRLGGRAWVSVNKAIVTQASAAIPVVPLYMSILMKVMQERGVEEGAIEQIDRLFREFLSGDGKMRTDAGGRIRLDDQEMREEVQSKVSGVWPTVTTENLHQVSDFAWFKRQFRNLFGFEVPGVDYSQPTEIDLAW